LVTGTINNLDDYLGRKCESEQRKDEWIWGLHREEVLGRRIALFSSAGSHRVNRVILREMADCDICGEYDYKEKWQAGHGLS
jgi:hypothetical protein